MDRTILAGTAVFCLTLYALKNKARTKGIQSKRDIRFNQRLEAQAMTTFLKLSQQVEDEKIKRALIDCGENIWDEASDTILEKDYLKCVDRIASYLGVAGPRLSILYDRENRHGESMSEEDEEEYEGEFQRVTPSKKRKRHPRNESGEDADDESSVADSDISEFGSRPLKKLRLLTTCALCSREFDALDNDTNVCFRHTGIALHHFRLLFADRF